MAPPPGAEGADDVLRQAGFDVPATARRRRGGASEAAARQRARAVPVDAIERHVLDKKGTFVLADLSRAGGRLGGRGPIRRGW